MAHIEKTSPNTLVKKLSPTDVTQQGFTSFKYDVNGLKTQTIDTDTVYVDSETGLKYKIYFKNGEINYEEVA